MQEEGRKGSEEEKRREDVRTVGEETRKEVKEGEKKGWKKRRRDEERNQ